MTDAVLIKIGYLVAAVVAYELLRWRLVLATHEFRTRAGCEADRWAADPRVHPRMRTTLTAIADNAYRPSAPWIVLSGWVFMLFLPPGRLRDTEVSDEPEVTVAIGVLLAKLFFAAILTSPLACVLAVVVLAAGLLLRGSVEALARYVAAAGDRFFANAAGYSRPA